MTRLVLALLILWPGLARADARRGVFVGLTLDAKLDDPNPLTNTLSYTGAGAKLGYHASVAGVFAHVVVGAVGGDETDGKFLEVGTGVDVTWRSGPMVAGVQLEVARASLDYEWKGATNAQTAIVVEPRAFVGVHLGPDVVLGLGAGWRWKLVQSGDAYGDDRAPSGFSMGLELRVER